jgi:hypothetical protein
MHYDDELWWCIILCIMHYAFYAFMHDAKFSYASICIWHMMMIHVMIHMMM